MGIKSQTDPNKGSYQIVDLTFQEKKILDFLFRWIRPIRPGDLKGFFNIKRTTLNSQLEGLEKKDLIEWKRYGTISLTTVGKKYAAHLTRHHRLLESFLVEVLDVPVEEAHEISMELTPVVSCKLIKYIINKIGEKDHCPCGYVIPKKDLLPMACEG